MSSRKRPGTKLGFTAWCDFGGGKNWRKLSLVSLISNHSIGDGVLALCSGEAAMSLWDFEGGDKYGLWKFIGGDTSVSRRPGPMGALHRSHPLPHPLNSR